MNVQRLVRLGRARDTARESRDGEAGRSSRSAFVAAILIALVLACIEREVSGAHEGSFRARLEPYFHHVAVTHTG
jgi:hypothetical protein